MHDAEARRLLLIRVPLFSSLSVPEAKTLAAAARPRVFNEGDVVLREGEAATSMFVIVAGEGRVVGRGASGSPLVLARLSAGDHTGELGLLPDGDGRHGASVVATTRLTTLEVDREDFLRTQRRSAWMLQALKDLGERQVRQRLARTADMFTPLRVLEGERAWLQRRVFDDGQVVMRQGDPSSEFYLVVAGEARVVRREGDVEQELARLGPGRCFGERAVLRGDVRSATVVASGRLETLSLSGERLLVLCERSPELREYLDTLVAMYQLPQRGTMSVHQSRLSGLECVSTLYHLPGGVDVCASRVVGQALFVVYRVGVDSRRVETERYQRPEEGILRELHLVDGVVVGATVQGGWNELARAHELVLDGGKLESWQVALFREQGALHLEAAASFSDDREIICTCARVTRRQIKLTIAAGWTTFDEVARRTGASLVCGGCTPKLRALVGGPDMVPVEVEAAEVGQDIKAFRLRPRSGQVEMFLPGQHLLVEALVDEQWVQRSYTISSASTERGFYEITVKREPMGVLSRHIYDRQGAMVRVSKPRGHYRLDPDERRPVVFFAGGIGVTPALAMARTIAAAGWKVPFFLDYSASTRSLQVAADELRELAERTPNVSVRLRCTREEGRLRRDEVVAAAEASPGARFFVCGGESFQQAVVGALREAGVPDQDVLVETFIHAGAPIKQSRRPPPPPRKRPSAGCPAHTPQENVQEVEQPAYGRDLPPEQVRSEAEQFLRLFYGERGAMGAFEARWQQVRDEINARGTYTHTYDELAHGARVAWRNAARCIGRLAWQSLQVRDHRDVRSEEGMFDALVEHLRLGTSGGNLRSTMTVFAPKQPGQPGPRVWNNQLIRYAGYRSADGSVLGDGAEVDVTEQALGLGWRGGPGTRFDLLPLIVQLPGRPPRFFELPRDAVLEVPLRHPRFAWFEELALRWYALPAVSSMALDLGGVLYTAAPFNGIYMETEIGARNLCDGNRYNMLPAVAERMGLDTSSPRTLWRDQALIELNIAVLHSYDRSGVSLLDHHAASDQFIEFSRQEATAGRPLAALWSWIVPPVSAAITRVYHTDFDYFVEKPYYFHQQPPWKAEP